MLTSSALDKIERIAVALERIADALQEHGHEREHDASMPVIQVEPPPMSYFELQRHICTKLAEINGLDLRLINTIARNYTGLIGDIGFDAWVERCLDGTIDLLSVRSIGPTYRERILASLRAWKKNGKHDS